jgi:hypothetical protein
LANTPDNLKAEPDDDDDDHGNSSELQQPVFYRRVLFAALSVTSLFLRQERRRSA